MSKKEDKTRQIEAMLCGCSIREDKFCGCFNYPKKFCCLSLEKGATALALVLLALCIATIALWSFLISTGPMKFGDLVDESEEIYRITFAIFIGEFHTDGWETWTRIRGGVSMTFALGAAITTILGLVGIQRRSPLLVIIYYCGSGLIPGLGIFTIIDLTMEAEDFTTTAGVAWTLIIMVSLAILCIGTLLLLPVYSLYLKLRREVKEEQVYKISFTSILCSH